ncbi:nitrate/sulfonate/bicarbonate ABC transporter ATP-binding protein [Desulfosporosinus sp. PR]|uniref:ABC transporter ATP-binding protein n=1 Tax=Candidatus Desulfosporosinus nitrosoreducens TaxID=3401928 RepID=UPI0027F7FE64|nr:nitrate/sulfonate/bicarbonate ABC transporter ATP-binding protein [Desulfosporosinus sp. PR]MDQ7095110.1 nitrate/sulfonate/bicarbonate ABC transporter ATP-binding protein [Desulfosporosinus sp. PR]
MSKALIKLEHIFKSYDLPGNNNATVLSDISLEVKEREFVAILGPSGSGKSTLLRIIAGLVKPTQGKVSYQKEAGEGEGFRKGMSMVFQSFALFPWLTVLENVKLGLKNNHKLSEKQKQEKAIATIDMIGLDGFEGAYPKELSGGMKQRVGLGRALVMEPDLLLMDEPFSALDVLTAENLKRDLLELWMEKRIPTKSIIMVTHGIEEAVYMANRAVVLSRDPARVVANIAIDLPHWRDKQDKAFTALVDKIYSILTAKEVEVKTQKEDVPKKIKQLPHARAGALTGFIELLDDIGLKTDLYKLGEQLSLDLEDLLPIVEAASLLKMVAVKEGDIELTSIGKEFAEATVLQRKELFREQALQHVASLNTVISALNSKSNGKMPEEFFLNVLTRHFGEEEAANQLTTIIDWGRYAELFAYDEHIGQIYLEKDDI